MYRVGTFETHLLLPLGKAFREMSLRIEDTRLEASLHYQAFRRSVGRWLDSWWLSFLSIIHKQTLIKATIFKNRITYQVSSEIANALAWSRVA